MGCSNSNILNKLNPFASFRKQPSLQHLAEPYEIRQEKFHGLKKILDLISSESLMQLANKLLTAKKDLIKSNLDRIWEKNAAKLEENLITPKMFESSFYILLGESLISNHFLIENKNLASYLNNFLSSKNFLSAEELDTLTQILSDPNLELISHESIMHIDLSLINNNNSSNNNNINISNGLNNNSIKLEDAKIIKKAVDKLRYDEANFPSAVFLHINFDILTSKSDLLTDFLEVISRNNKLTFFAVILNPLALSKENNKKYLFTMNPFMYMNLFKIFEAVKNNKSIKHLVFTANIQSKIILAPEISNLILKKIAEDNLFGIYIGKILLTETFLKDFFSQLGNLNKLKYFCFDISGFNQRLSSHLNTVIGTNRSLEIIGFLGFKFNEEDFKALKNCLKRNFNIRLVLNKERFELF